jgi:hypothetical protein
MNSRTIPRLLLTGLLFAFVAANAIHFSAAAKGSGEWSDTQSRENVFVEACGSSIITTSFTTTRTHRDVTDYREHVRFAGSVGNDITGHSYAYDGHYDRAAIDDQGGFAVTDLLLRFEVGTPGMFTVSFKQVGFRLADSPPGVIQTIVPRVLQMDLCSALGGPTMSNNVSMPPINAPADTATQPCHDQPRMGLPYGC